MGKKFKSHKTVEQIAKKHRLDVSFIEKQLKIGEPIEHEHTQDHNLARDIALQHLDEIPDYYTRLKKMEASAKKDHKKFKDVKEDVSIEDMFGNTFAEVIDLIQAEKLKESDTVRKGILPFKNTQIKRSTGAGALSPEAAAELGDRAVELRKKKLAQTELPKIKKEETESLVDKIISEEEEILNNKTSKIYEATRLQAETGNIIAVTLSWRGKYYSIRMFFPQTKLPNRSEINFEINKIYPGSKVIHHSVSELPSGNPLIRVGSGSYAKPGPSKNYVKPMGEETEAKFATNQKEEVEISEAKKSEMKCNSPKAEAHGSGETGKSHVVKACEGGKEKLIRFGQLGVKGSPKKKGESKAYASRRHRFQTRHAKNISKGKMSAAYWANKVKW